LFSSSRYTQTEANAQAILISFSLGERSILRKYSKRGLLEKTALSM
jgi:hypothetical protein